MHAKSQSHSLDLGLNCEKWMLRGKAKLFFLILETVGLFCLFVIAFWSPRT